MGDRLDTEWGAGQNRAHTATPKRGHMCHLQGAAMRTQLRE